MAAIFEEIPAGLRQSAMTCDASRSIKLRKMPNFIAACGRALWLTRMYLFNNNRRYSQPIIVPIIAPILPNSSSGYGPLCTDEEVFSQWCNVCPRLVLNVTTSPLPCSKNQYEKRIRGDFNFSPSW